MGDKGRFSDLFLGTPGELAPRRALRGVEQLQWHAALFEELIIEKKYGEACSIAISIGQWATTILNNAQECADITSAKH